MNEYKIEKGIQIPTYRAKWRQLAESMEVGDSVIVNGRVEAMNLRNAIVKLGFRAVTRGNDTPQARVWKLNKNTYNETDRTGT